MKITAVETINLAEFPNVLWVQIHTDEGIVGLGETFYAVAPVAEHIHQTCAEYLLGDRGHGVKGFSEADDAFVGEIGRAHV